LRGEAEIATVNIASKVASSDPEGVKAILQDVILQTSNRRVSQQAQEIIDKLEKNYGDVISWQMAGPYTKKPLFKTAHEPETNAGNVKWKLIHGDPAGATPFVFDLGKLVGGNDRVVYLRTYIWSDADIKAELLMGSDDAVTAWVNGSKVHSKDTVRPLKVDQDKAQIVLKKGFNELMLKVIQYAGQWSGCARIRDIGGGKVSGIKISTSKD
jgi:hypothetical protein